ncbi:MAG TPA: RNA-binding protein [Terriglobia bacterium]|nr:RNA-binding protein [Terriglobia bacterium]
MPSIAQITITILMMLNWRLQRRISTNIAMDGGCGYAFVEMVDESAAKLAIAELNGKTIHGRCLTVRLGF